jgi:hypothetical protein
MSLSYNSISRLPKQGTSVVVTSNTLVLMFLASREHAHDLLLVSVLVSKVELKLSNMTFKSSQANRHKNFTILSVGSSTSSGSW